MTVLTSDEIQGSSNSCRAFVNFYWNGSSAVIRGGYNVSSVSTFGTGIYGINYINGIGSSTYSIAGSSRANGGYVGSNWAQYVSFYDLSTSASGMTVMDNGDSNVGGHEHTALGLAAVYA